MPNISGLRYVLRRQQWKKSGPGRGKRIYKGPEARKSTLCLGKCKLLKRAVAEEESDKGGQSFLLRSLDSVLKAMTSLGRTLKGGIT